MFPNQSSRSALIFKKLVELKNQKTKEMDDTIIVPPLVVDDAGTGCHEREKEIETIDCVDMQKNENDETIIPPLAIEDTCTGYDEREKEIETIDCVDMQENENDETIIPPLAIEDACTGYDEREIEIETIDYVDMQENENNDTIMPPLAVEDAGTGCHERVIEVEILDCIDILEYENDEIILPPLAFEDEPTCQEREIEMIDCVDMPENENDEIIMPPLAFEDEPFECLEREIEIEMIDCVDMPENENDEAIMTPLAIEDAGTGVTDCVQLENEKKPKRRRKGKADPSQWKKNMSCSKRKAGKQYINTRGKLIAAKTPAAVDCSACRYKCSTEFTEEQRATLCSKYWGLADADRQKSFLCSAVEEQEISRRIHGADHSKRSTVRKYFLTYNDKKQRVCLKFFCATISISHRIIEWALKNKENGMYVGSDGRKGKCSANTTSREAINFIREHINSFPRMESHYCRRDTSKEYLASDLNISIMYRLYKEEFCPDKNIVAVMENVYRKTFYNFEPALAFFIPKKDQCSKCNMYTSLADKSSFHEEYVLHKKREHEAMDMKKADKEKAIADKGKSFRAISFDMQAVMSIPHAGDSLIYYKRKLSVYNFTIFDGHNADGFCYVWDETNGKKGSCEVASCLLKYISSLPSSVTHVSTFSDTCGGQNRNQNVAAAMMYAVNNYSVQTIDLKFMESGHSYLEADSIHSTIERARKHKKIYSTNEWGLLIGMSRRKPRPYNVEVLNYNDFKNIDELTKMMISNLKKDSNGHPVNWLKIKWARFERSCPDEIKFKYDLMEDFRVLPLTTGRRSGRSRSWKCPLSGKYSGRLPISSAKKADLLDLLRKKIIPEEYSPLIEGLPSEGRNP